MGSSFDDSDKQTALLQELADDGEHQGEVSGEAHYTVVAIVSFFLPLLSIGFLGFMVTGLYVGTKTCIAATGAESAVVHSILLASNFTVLVTVELLLAIAIKRGCCPRFRGRTPIWSYAFLRWQVFGSVMNELGGTVLGYIQGTALMAPWLRALGAEVGDGVFFNTIPPVETDCLIIADGATVLEAPQSLVPHALDHGMLQFAPIRIGQDASIGMSACVQLLACLEDGAVLEAQSLLFKSDTIAAHTNAQGIPAVQREGAGDAYSWTQPEVASTRCCGCCASIAAVCICFRQEEDDEEVEQSEPLIGKAS